MKIEELDLDRRHRYETAWAWRQTDVDPLKRVSPHLHAPTSAALLRASAAAF